MQTYIKQAFLFAFVLFLIDIAWLAGASKLHKQTVLSVQKSEMQISKLPAFAFYLLAGMAYVIFIRKLAKNKKDALLYGAAMGAAMYFTFDFTNKAIFKDYTWQYAIMDGLWGTMAMGVASYITYRLV